jgi:hypothetical protein
MSPYIHTISHTQGIRKAYTSADLLVYTYYVTTCQPPTLLIVGTVLRGLAQLEKTLHLLYSMDSGALPTISRIQKIGRKKK